MSTSASTPVAPRTLASLLTRRLFWIAAVVLLANLAGVGFYYGTNRFEIESEVIVIQMDRIEAALERDDGRVDAETRALYERHPDAYAFAIVDARGRVLDSANLGLVPPGAIKDTGFGDDWVAHRKSDAGVMLVALRRVEIQGRDVRILFVKIGDPSNLMGWALLGEMIRHAVLPIIPTILVLIGANAIHVRRVLAPVTVAARWAREIRPGLPPPQLPESVYPAEIIELVDATRRSLGRLQVALDAEKRRSSEAAHALRTPAAVLVARIDSLPPGPVTEQLRADLATLSRTIRQVLTSSRADALQVDEFARADLGQIAARVSAALASFAASRSVEITLDLSVEPVIASADADAAYLALFNLVENAIIHAGPGVVDITVGPGAEICVRDRGPGLASSERRALFRPFWRGANAPPGGAGLGLAIVERLQQAQGGDVSVEAPQDGGTAFVLRFRKA